ncbi:hypothetical protein [Leucobacter luti]|uniref:hypothetical protein n=1 Tax=Leucobacter luti TaxID=340320 RepID=UPI001C692A42|nr:hypothetical protein [Leucobacter luti]QYM75328.1 hypothetical protein K1X41_11855 [Leucobacter luti]
MGTGKQHEATAVVWIVCHDESPDNTVLGVFATGAEAEAYAGEVQHLFENGVIFTSFPIGYRHIDGVVRYSAPDVR